LESGKFGGSEKKKRLGQSALHVGFLLMANKIATAWRLARECLDSESAAPWSNNDHDGVPKYVDTSSIHRRKAADFSAEGRGAHGGIKCRGTKDTINR
jgi:hypothetical protein